jgi:hypothetical protein
MSESFNTSCEKCHFAKDVSSEQTCTFYIPDALSESKKIEVINNYNYIHNYRCKYGISQKIYDEKIKDMNIDIVEYAKQQVSPKYALFIDFSGTDEDLNQVCKNINSLTIKPKAISIALHHTCSTKNAAKICEGLLGSNLKWKLHYFVTEKEHHEMLDVCTTTDNRLSECVYIWLMNQQTLATAIELDSINKINYIVNVEQPSVGLLHTSKFNGYFYGLFLTLENLKGICTHIHYDISKAVEESYINSIYYYD